MKNLLSIVALLVLISCSSAPITYKEITYCPTPEFISLGYRSIEKPFRGCNSGDPLYFTDGEVYQCGETVPEINGQIVLLKKANEKFDSANRQECEFTAGQNFKFLCEMALDKNPNLDQSISSSSPYKLTRHITSSTEYKIINQIGKTYDLVADTPLVCFWKNDEGNEIIK